MFCISSSSFRLSICFNHTYQLFWTVCKTLVWMTLISAILAFYITIWPHYSIVTKLFKTHCMFCSNVLFSRPPIRLLQSILGQTCQGCMNHDMLVDLCSELIMRLSYYIRRAYGKKFLTLEEIKPRTSRLPITA